MTTYWQRAQNCISQGALTNSKHPESLIYGLYPTHISHGHGCHLYDQNEKKYVDYICGLGTNLLGYGNDLINKEIMKHLYGGYSHSLPTIHEVDTSEKLKEIFPYVDSFKFLKSGSEACTASIKIARAMTGRKTVLVDGYHGWHDAFTHMVPPGYGTEACESYLEGDGLSIEDGDIAAIIIEPIIVDCSKDRIEYLKALREKCTKYGTLLIFDEVITGFRYEKFSVANVYGIIPDLTVLGKGMANGMPLAAVGGKNNLMQDRRWFVSSTYAGEVLSLAACRKTVELLQSNYSYKIDYLWEMGKKFIDTFNEMPGHIKIKGYPTRGVFTGDETEIAIFFQEMAKANILFCKSWFYNWDLIDVQEDVLDIAWEIKHKIENKSVKLEYPLPVSPFAAKVRDHG